MHCKLGDRALDWKADDIIVMSKAASVGVLEGGCIRVDFAPQDTSLAWSSIQAVSHTVAMHYIDDAVLVYCSVCEKVVE